MGDIIKIIIATKAIFSTVTGCESWTNNNVAAHYVGF